MYQIAAAFWQEQTFNNWWIASLNIPASALGLFLEINAVIIHQDKNGNSYKSFIFLMLVNINDSIGFCQLHCQRNENLTPKQPLDVYNPHPQQLQHMHNGHCTLRMHNVPLSQEDGSQISPDRVTQKKTRPTAHALKLSQFHLDNILDRFDVNYNLVWIGKMRWFPRPLYQVKGCNICGLDGKLTLIQLRQACQQLEIWDIHSWVHNLSSASLHNCTHSEHFNSITMEAKMNHVGGLLSSQHEEAD